MPKILLVGAGKIGSAIAKMLQFAPHSGYPGYEGYELVVADVNAEALERLDLPVQKFHLLPDTSNLEEAMAGCDAVLSACSFSANKEIASLCFQNGQSYFDLTEDVSTTNFIKKIAAGARDGQIFMPQCGLAPGFIGISAYALTKEFDKIDTVKMRVGALPMYPSNTMKYNLTWSTDGLINEYCNFCECIYDGHVLNSPALEGLEHFSVDGVEYEAFNTSGGLGTLCETLAGKVRQMDYKTARYPGHRDLMDFLVNGLRFTERRKQLKDLFDTVIPLTKQDVILIFTSVTGWKDGRFEQVSDVRKIYSKELFGELWSGIQITTAAGICASLDLHFEGKLPERGFVRQEDVVFHDYINNRFGKYYNEQ